MVKPQPSPTEALKNRLAPVVSRRGGLALGIWGPAGQGKTYTVQQLLQQLPCRSFSFHATTSLAKLLQGLPRPRKGPLWAETLRKRLEQGEALEETKSAEVVGALLAALAPVVLHLDDLHEVDEGRLEFTQALASNIAKLKGVGLLVSSRERLPRGFVEVRLEPLSAEQVKEMLEGEVGAALPAEALGWIGARAGGNPLFALEFFRFLARQGSLWNDGQRWRWREPQHTRVPTSVEVLIERSLHEAASTPDLEAALAAKAVLGPGAGALWAQVLNLTPEALADLVQPLAEAGVLRSGEFAHPLYHQVLLQNLLPERHRNLARQALKHLEGDPRTAAQLLEAAHLEAPQALTLLIAAAEAAQQAGNPLEAARFGARATKYALGAERASLALKAAQGLRQADLSEASRLAEMAAQEASLSQFAGALAAELLAVEGRLEAAEERLARAGVSGHEHEVLSLSLRVLARDFVGATRHWRHSPALQSSDDPRVSRSAVQALLSTDNPEEARPVLARALTRSDLPSADRLALEGLEANLLYIDGHTEEAIERWKARVPALVEAGDLRGAARSLHNQGVAMQRLGKISAAVEPHRRCVRLYAQTGDLRAYADALSTYAWDLWHLAEYPEAEALFLESRDLLRRYPASDYLVECEGCLSLLYLDWSPPLAADLAHKHATAALEAARTLGNPYDIVASLHDCVLAKLRLGKPHDAMAMAEEMVELSEAHSLKALGINARYCKALALEALGEKDQALALMQEAEALHQGGETFEHKIGIEVARMEGDLDKARQHLEWFQAQEMFNGVRVLERYFPELAQVQAPTVEPTLRLEVLGPMRIVREESELPMRGNKRRELLALLLEARLSGRHEVARLDLFETLYPQSEELQAGIALKDIVYQLRELLGAQVIQTTEGGYALGAIRTDVEEFLQSGDTGLWRGAYLEGLSLEYRDSVAESLHRALSTRAEALLQSDPDEAARIGHLLCEHDPYAPEPLRLTLRALQIGKNHKALSRTYARARERLSEVGEILPDSWVEFVARDGL